MDPFKKSLGLNFGPLISAAKEPATGNNNRDDKTGAELSRFRTPKNTPKPPFDEIGGLEVEDWIWVSTSSPLEQNGYWKPVLGWPVVKNAPPVIIGSSEPPNDPLPPEPPQEPCPQTYTETEETQGVRIVKKYTKPCGSGQWNCTETHFDTAKDNGIGFKSIIAVKPCTEPIWDKSMNKDEIEKIKDAYSYVLNKKECIDSYVPGLSKCIENLWTKLIFSTINSSEFGSQAEVKKSSSPTQGTKLVKAVISFYRPNSYKYDMETFSSLLLHEIAHLCDIYLDKKINTMPELDVSLLINMCFDKNKLNTPDQNDWKKKWRIH